MKKTFGVILLMLLLNGCFSSMAVLGTGAANGRVAQSAINTTISYGIKHQTGKTPIEHAISYSKQQDAIETKSKCVCFLYSTNSEICLKVKQSLAKVIREASSIKDLN